MVFDAVVNYQNEWWLMEYKTGKPSLENLVFDASQGPLYLAFARKHEFLSELPVVGIIYNLLHESEDFEREPIRYIDHELDESLRELSQAMNDIFNDNVYRKRSFLCKSCDFVHLCRAEIQGLDIDYTKGNLYRARNKS